MEQKLTKRVRAFSVFAPYGVLSRFSDSSVGSVGGHGRIKITEGMRTPRDNLLFSHLDSLSVWERG